MSSKAIRRRREQFYDCIVVYKNAYSIVGKCATLLYVYTYAIWDERTTYVSRKGIFFLYGTTNDKTAMLHIKQCNFRGPCVHTLQQCRVHALDLPFGDSAQCLFNVQYRIRTFLDAN
jgi:hypothetical protein